MISTTGRRPRSAAPIAPPRIADSEIGVSKTRAPKRSRSPLEAVKTPPGIAKSSPKAIASGNSSSARWSAALTAET